MVLFSQTLPFRCTDPRDHIIALLGISADYSMREDLVDYTVPAEILYHRLACSCLKNSRDLKILWSFLSVVPLDRRASNSWLTNFDELPNIKGLALTTLSMAQNDVRILNASGSTELTASTSGNRLQIKGRMVDRLEQLGTDISGFPEFERTHDSPRMIREIMTHLDRWLDECEAIAQVANRDDDSFRSTMLIESLLQSIFPDISTAKAEWRTYRATQKTIIFSSEYGGARDQAYATMRSNPSSARIQYVTTKLLYRRFARTKYGRIGWAPQVAEEGDLICVFDGMEFPYVVRPIRGIEGVYALVGECYISDLMDGEALKVPGVESKIINLQ
jgi:hypothetical protein